MGSFTGEGSADKTSPPQGMHKHCAWGSTLLMERGHLRDPRETWLNMAGTDE